MIVVMPAVSSAVDRSLEAAQHRNAILQRLTWLGMRARPDSSAYNQRSIPMTMHTQADRQDPRGANRADIPVGLTALLADMFAVYLKTKNFHWHVSGPHFRDYHLLLDEQATQILATTDTIAERVRKLGAQTIKSISHISRLQHIEDNDADEVAPRDMLRELLQDNQRLAEEMLKLHTLCDEQGDVASASLIEVWIDEAQGRAWFLLEAVRLG
jgi:starvation-inducible DNA-binding protein